MMDISLNTKIKSGLFPLVVVITLTALLLGIYVFICFYFANAKQLFDPGENRRYLPVSTESYDFFDLGVTDTKNDGFLDIFSTHHSARQNFLSNVKGNFSPNEKLSDALSQTHNIPSIEDTDVMPEFLHPGLYIYRYKRWLHFTLHDRPDLGLINIHVSTPWEVTFDSLSKVAVTSNEQRKYKSDINFRLQDGDTFKLIGNQDIVELPHKISVSDSIQSTEIYLGRKLVNPESRSFTLMWRDRHGMAWSDFNSDGILDVYISRGGVKGQLAFVDAQIEDELFLSDGPLFKDSISDFGFVKSNCPGRDTKWVDANTDGLLDLFIVCSREKPNFEDQLWIREKSNNFVESSKEYGIANSGRSIGLWLDIDSDNDIDYLAKQDAGLFLYRNKSNGFEKEQLATEHNSPLLTFTSILKFTSSDFDNDGDLDIFGVGRRHSILLMNENGNLLLIDPTTIGLPSRGLTANWVDTNNDGLLDLHVLPSGIYRQLPNGMFESTNTMNFSENFSKLIAARCTWFDLDNSGSLDATCAVRYEPALPVRAFDKLWNHAKKTSREEIAIFKTKPDDNHWLQIKLMGPPENRESIGAVVTVVSNEKRYTQQVGQFEGSHYSQGHYRLYFGLGNATSIDSVEILWRTGVSQTILNPAMDQLLYVDHEVL